MVTIEVDGRTLEARKGAMLIEATDAAGIYVPRFCYHDKLSVAANCRMCLVEVEKAPKPLPACATPVVDGMKVRTRSPLALDAQRSTMEFLLINHPLDCPICDQGGECELQDLAMGYGNDVSRYTERKRVVKDKDIGPLIQTDMTRCIHCTRCIRFGEEIAGLRELGATGRGEHMEIGTYVARAVGSELSGNVIDLCPVGALTSKPYRYTARAWELRQHEAVAPHDSVGSNLYVHAKGNVVKRVVPRENGAINESWIADRDRYAYLGLNHADRLTMPLLKDGGRWREVDWQTVLGVVADRLRAVCAQDGPAGLGMLANPSARLEELYLFAKLGRALGVTGIDHRLRQQDFSDDDVSPLAPWLGGSIASLEEIDAALLIGTNVRKEQPLINHRLRKAGLRGARLAVVNPVDFDFNWPVSARFVSAPEAMVSNLAGIARALLGDGSGAAGALAGVTVEPDHQRVAESLRQAQSAVVLLGNMALSHPDLARLRWLADVIASASGARLGYLPEAGNSVGAALAGVLPHRGPGGQAVGAGLNARALLESRPAALALYGLEPEFDCWDPALALAAARAARFVVSFTAHRSAAMDEYAHVLLPIAGFAEAAGTYVNCAGDWQSCAAAVKPPGDARPGWRVLRVLGNRLDLDGFDYQDVAEVREELAARVHDRRPPLAGCSRAADTLGTPSQGLRRVTWLGPYSLDPLVRRSQALQRSPDGADDAVRVAPALAERLGCVEGDAVTVRQGGAEVRASLRVDARVPHDCVLLFGARECFVPLGGWYGGIELIRQGDPGEQA
ncbi:MAG: NADH-quinone oxidoreductase subunit G [Gammaproteobacteria bacterium]|nr:NADH-quinone oxidoreductase subunit G [Gammaproteobacteria bacterium]